jgi:hypothetical protein
MDRGGGGGDGVAGLSLDTATSSDAPPPSYPPTPSSPSIRRAGTSSTRSRWCRCFHGAGRRRRAGREGTRLSRGPKGGRRWTGAGDEPVGVSGAGVQAWEGRSGQERDGGRWATSVRARVAEWWWTTTPQPGSCFIQHLPSSPPAPACDRPCRRTSSSSPYTRTVDARVHSPTAGTVHPRHQQQHISLRPAPPSGRSGLRRPEPSAHSAEAHAAGGACSHMGGGAPRAGCGGLGGRRPPSDGVCVLSPRIFLTDPSRAPIPPFPHADLRRRPLEQDVRPL